MTLRTIGLSGFAGSGKTAAAQHIEKQWGFQRRHIAEPLRRMLASLMRDNGIEEEMIERYLTGDLKDGVIIPEFGVTSRDLQITLGTEWGRTHVGENLWVDTWHRGIKPGERVMNDSVRFPNEERAIKEDRGITILIRRPGTGPAKFKSRMGRLLYKLTGLMWGVHDSERVDRLRPTYIIDNDGSLDDLYRQIDAAIYAALNDNAVLIPEDNRAATLGLAAVALAVTR
jgi:hypothetical protein